MRAHIIYFEYHKHYYTETQWVLQGDFFKTSRKWLTVAIFRKWQDSNVALWIEIAVITFQGFWYSQFK